MRYLEAKDIGPKTTVTVGELRAAVARVMTEQFDDVTENEAGLLATDLVRDIFNHREPEWKAGDVVRDDFSGVWQRTADGDWLKFGDRATFRHDVPVRPLTLLWSPQGTKCSGS